MNAPLTINERAEIIHGCKISDEFKQYMLRVKKATGMRDSDEMWYVLMLTTHITDAIIQAKNEIRSTPENMQTVSDNIIQSYRNSAKLAIDEASAVGLKELAKSVSSVASKVAKQAIIKSMLETAAYCILLTAMILASVGHFAYNAGFNVGYSEKAFDEIKSDIKSECLKSFNIST